MPGCKLNGHHIRWQKQERGKNMSSVKRIGKGKSLLDLPDNYIVVDLETTGLDPVGCEIIEIGAIRCVGGEELDRFESLIKPSGPLPSIITQITGLRDSDLQEAPSIDEVLPEFLNYVGDSILVGHNVNFDVNFLYEKTLEHTGALFTNSFVDTLRLSRILYPGVRSHKLADMGRLCRIPNRSAHRAMADVEQTWRLYEYMKHRVLAEDLDLDLMRRRCF